MVHHTPPLQKRSDAPSFVLPGSEVDELFTAPIADIMQV
jgi:hypothetical protein